MFAIPKLMIKMAVGGMNMGSSILAGTAIATTVGANAGGKVVKKIKSKKK